MSNLKLINCIYSVFKDKLQKYAQELYVNGIVVIDLDFCISDFKEKEFIENTDFLKEIRKIQLQDFKTDNPEYGFVLGAFGAFGNPASFHNELLYKLRYILFKNLSKIFSNIDAERYLECLFDRFCIRRKDTQITGESFHRDTCSLMGDTDNIYGGWINLNSKKSKNNQYFSCVPGTHTCTGRGGFEKISGNYDNAKIKIEIKPKQVIIFNQNIIHEINKQKFKEDSIRLYLGWRHTNSSLPLFNNKVNKQFNINSIIKYQIVPPLPSGDLPYMYTKNHPRLFKSKIEQISSEIKDFYLTKNPKYKNGVVIKRSLDYPIQLVKITDEYKKIYYPNKLFY